MACKDCNCGRAQLEAMSDEGCGPIVKLEDLFTKEVTMHKNIGCEVIGCSECKERAAIKKLEERSGPDVRKFFKELSEEAPSETKGLKYDNNKPRMDLIPEIFAIGVAKAFGFGALKYHVDNFRLGIPMRKLLASAKRHIELELAGIDQDKESKLEHWMLAGASLAMYSFMKRFRPNMDDRYKYTDEEKEMIEKEMYGE